MVKAVRELGATENKQIEVPFPFLTQHLKCIPGQLTPAKVSKLKVYNGLTSFSYTCQS